jgi:hypothetical protein
MRIAEDLPERLTLEARPWALGSVLVAAILLFCALSLFTVGQNLWLGLGMALGAALFGLAFVVFVRRIIVIFDRPAQAVVIRTASLLGQTEVTHPLPAIRAAGIETQISANSSTGGRSQTHRTVLQFHGGARPEPLTQIYSGGQGAQRMADAINRWLGTTTEDAP